MNDLKKIDKLPMKLQVSHRQNSNMNIEIDKINKPLLGQISFINNLPVVWPLQNSLVEIQAEMVLANPAELNAMLASSKLMMGAMSSYYFLSDKRFELIKGLAISSAGPVGSVLLFSKKKLIEFPNKFKSEQTNLNCAIKIVVPNSSASSVKLMQIMLLEDFLIDSELKVGEFSDIVNSNVDAVLVIGDEALRADFQYEKLGLERTDLGAWWHKKYSLPFVFGLWGVRKDWLNSNFELVESITESLCQARNLGLSTYLNDIIAESNKRTSIDSERLKFYYKNELDFSFTKEHQEGLNLFSQLCYKHKFMQE